MWLSTTLLALGVLGDNVGQQDDALETLGCPSAKQGGFTLPRIKASALATKPDWNARRQSPCEENEDSKEEDPMLVNNERDREPRQSDP